MYQFGAVSGPQSTTLSVDGMPNEHDLVYIMCSTNVLVYQDDTHVLSILRKPVKGGFDGSSVGFAIHDQEVLLGIGASCDVLYMIFSL